MTNNTQYNLKLNQASVSQETKARLMGLKDPLQNFVGYAENANVSLETPAGITFLRAQSKNFASKMTAGLNSLLAESTVKKGRGTFADKVIAESMENMIRQDISLFNEKFEQQVQLFSESMLAGTYRPFQLAMIPYIYLETIAANSRFIMPTKQYASEQLPPKKAKTKLLIIGDKTYKFPNCLKDPEVMAQLYNTGSTTKEVTVVLADNSKCNVFDLIDGYAKDRDRLLPQADIVSIKYMSTDETPVPVTDAVALDALMPNANNYTMGRISAEIAIKEKSADTDKNATAYISGSIDFASGELKLLADTVVKEVTLKVHIAGDAMSSSASVGINTEPIIQMIKNRMNFTFSYDPGALEQYMQLEKIDGVLEGQSIIFDSSIAAKDAYAFNVLKDTQVHLKQMQQEMGAEKFAQTNNFLVERIHHDNPASNTNFRPVSEEQWITDSIGKRMKEVHVDVYHKFNSKNGVTLNWYGSPQSVTKLIKGTPIISKGENYGGYCTDFAVFSVQVAQSVAKVVESERVADSEGLVCVPYSNSEEQPTFEFQQGIHALYTDNTLRDPQHPHLPAIAYYDYFDCQYIFAIMGKIALEA